MGSLVGGLLVAREKVGMTEALIGPADVTVENTADLTTAVQQGVTTVIGDTMYSFGGSLTTAGAAITNAYKYDLTVDNPAQEEIAAQPKAMVGSVAVSDGTFAYILGGYNTTSYGQNSVYKYDPSADTYTQLDDIPEARGFSGGGYYDGSIYYFGGITNTTSTAAWTNKISEYNVETGVVTDWIETLPRSLYFYYSVIVGDKIYVFNGLDGTTIYNETFVLDLTNKTVTQKASMTTPVVMPATYYDGGKYIYLVGGATNRGLSAWTTTVQRYDIEANTWSATTPTVAVLSKSHTQFGAYQNTLFVAGGRDTATVATTQKVTFPTVATLSTLLESLTTESPFVLSPAFNYSTLTYDVDIFDNTAVFPLTAVAYDSSATVTITGTSYMSEAIQNPVITITVSKEGEADTVYTLNLHRALTEVAKTDFAATGYASTFTAPANGNYRLEAWGASGGAFVTNTSGYVAFGSYTAGTLFMNADDKIYVYVGREGTNGNNDAAGAKAGGWNGGGNGGTKSSPARSGPGAGGATDFRLVCANTCNGTTDTTWSVANSLISRVMVAGGAGSRSQVVAGIVQSGGGLSSTTSGVATAATQLAGNAFGVGGAATNNSYNFAGGGGGGYWGGKGGTGNENSVGGSGGSSYISGHTGAIAVISASSTAPRTGTGGAACVVGTTDNLCSVHNSGKIFTDTLMIDGAGKNWTNVVGGQTAMPNPAGGTFAANTGKTAGGYARVTRLAPDNTNAFLRDLTVSAGSLVPTFDPETTNYTLALTADDATLFFN
ncbi:MAG: hypothetical protein LBM97_00940, partial [Candidatus Nomurabacteria bacterium]|nr:hypothetical protein [Candidatus Nomurabacteria bacterium]